MTDVAGEVGTLACPWSFERTGHPQKEEGDGRVGCLTFTIYGRFSFVLKNHVNEGKERCHRRQKIRQGQ